VYRVVDSDSDAHAHAGDCDVDVGTAAIRIAIVCVCVRARTGCMCVYVCRRRLSCDVSHCIPWDALFRDPLISLMSESDALLLAVHNGTMAQWHNAAV